MNRYDMELEVGSYKDPDGEWVRYEDVKTIVEERDKAQREGVEYYEALVKLVDERDAAVEFPPEEYQDFANACNVMAANSARPDHWHLLAEKAEAACARGKSE